MQDQNANKSMVVNLGDQSPWNGGLLRAKALMDLGYTVEYRHHDADTPGAKYDNAEYLLGLGNPPYFSLATRLPFSAPNTDACWQQLIAKCTPARQRDSKSPRSPRASVHQVAYVRANSDKVIYANQDEALQSAVAQMFGVEKTHLSVLSGVDIPGYASVAEAIAQHAGTVSVGSEFERFRDSRPVLLGKIPDEYFWGIDPSFRRLRYDSSRQDWLAIIPSAHALVLEISARGAQIAYSSCGYKESVVALRDRYLKRHPIHALRVQFDWRPDIDTSDTPLGRSIRSLSQQKGTVMDTSLLRDYWAMKPTSLGVVAFPAPLNPVVTHEVW